MSDLKFEYPKEIQEKLVKIRKHMLKWSGEQNDFFDMYADYDKERNRYSKKIGLSAKDVLNHILQTKEYNTKTHKNMGDLMTIQVFVDAINSDFILEEDGHGYYATDKILTDIPVYIPMFKKGLVRKDFTHIMWYGR